MKIYIYPTDTLWGIGCNIFDENAIHEIASIKKTVKGKPLSILFSNLDELNNYFDLPEKVTREWLLKFFGYQSTLLIPIELLIKKIPQIITCESSFVGVRYISNDATTQIYLREQAPITTSSVNLSGEEPILKLENIKKFIENHASCVTLYEADIVPSGEPSSLIKLSPIPTFLRKGQYSKEIHEHLKLLSA